MPCCFTGICAGKLCFEVCPTGIRPVPHHSYRSPPQVYDLSSGLSTPASRRIIDVCLLGSVGRGGELLVDGRDDRAPSLPARLPSDYRMQSYDVLAWLAGLFPWVSSRVYIRLYPRLPVDARHGRWWGQGGRLVPKTDRR